jgi:hypothetical protein
MSQPGAIRRPGSNPRSRRPTMEEINAAFEHYRQNRNSNINGPEHVSPAEQRRRELLRAHRLRPTIYQYVMPQDSSTLCILCGREDEHGPQSLFAGHDENQAAHRHLLCNAHYQENRMHTQGSCPTCRGIIDIWTVPKRVQIAADGTGTVISVGQRGGKRNHTHGRKRRHNCKRVTRRR